MKYFIFQGNDHDCGFTSLKMLLANLKKDKSFLYLKKCIKKDGLSVAELCKEARMHGLLLESYSVEEDYYDQIQTLSLTLLRNNHVVMVKKINKKKITYYDPEFGIITKKKDEFIAMWCKIVLEVKSSDCVPSLPKKRRNILPLKLRILEASAALISSAILIGVFYLLNNQQNALFSFIFIGLFLIAQIVENIIVSKEINFFDASYIKPYFSRRKNQSKLKYLEFIAYKQNFFLKTRGLLSSILVACMITFLLIFNDFRNVFVLLILLLLKSLELFVFSQDDENKKNKIEYYEEQCFSRKELCADYAFKASKLANKEASKNSLKQVLYMSVAFLFALGMMFITGNSGCNYVIFHFGLYYVAFTSYSQILNGLSNKKEMYKMECRFFDSCNL